MVAYTMHFVFSWFHKITRQDAEDMLKRVNEDGAFLVRQSQTAQDAFAVSFRFSVALWLNWSFVFHFIF